MTLFKVISNLKSILYMILLFLFTLSSLKWYNIVSVDLVSKSNNKQWRIYV